MKAPLVFVVASGLALAMGSAACSESPDSSSSLPKTLRSGTLDLEIRDEATVNIVELADGIEVTLTLSKGHTIVADGITLKGRGRIDEYPEADATLYTARFDAPMFAEGTSACGEQPVSLALSLHTDADNSVVAGGLTAYCGAKRWHGTPAREPLRLRGSFD